jgi:hypothetical protein
VYRANAEDCMRQAANDAAEGDRPLWATLARSWLQLAEQAGRISENDDADTVEPEPETAEEEAPAPN